MCSLIRRAVPGDEAALAFIQTESWKAAFHQILSPELLKKLTNVEQSEEMYRRLLHTGGMAIFFLSITNRIASLGGIRPGRRICRDMRRSSVSTACPETGIGAMEAK